MKRNANRKIVLMLFAGLLTLGFSFFGLSCAGGPAPENRSENKAENKTVANDAFKPEPQPQPEPTPRIELQALPGVVALRPSDIDEELAKYRKEHPGISAKEIADYGNSLLPQKGFNYWIDVGELNEKKIKAKQAKNISDDLQTYTYEMILDNGKRQKFLIQAPRNDSCCCGYYYADFPVIDITEKNITFVSDGKQYTVKRPADLKQSEVYALVDEKDKSKEIRKWQVPMEGFPLGISADGMILYGGGAFEDVVLGISPDGSFKFQDIKEMKSGKGVFCNIPDDPKDAYESCMQFKVGDKSYFIKFSGPCT